MKKEEEELCIWIEANGWNWVCRPPNACFQIGAFPFAVTSRSLVSLNSVFVNQSVYLFTNDGPVCSWCHSDCNCVCVTNTNTHNLAWVSIQTETQLLLSLGPMWPRAFAYTLKWSALSRKSRLDGAHKRRFLARSFTAHTHSFLFIHEMNWMLEAWVARRNELLDSNWPRGTRDVDGLCVWLRESSSVIVIKGEPAHK